MQPGMLPAPGITIQWAPDVYMSPCFNHFRDDAALKCLTGTGIALHEKQAELDRLKQQAAADKNAWERRRKDLEEQLASLTVRNAEAERLFKIKENELAKRLSGTQQALGDLVQDHQDLHKASNNQMAELQDKLDQVQRECKQLQGERARLQHQLRDAEVTAQARREAEHRVAQLESAIAATQERARDMINSITKQRDAADADRDILQNRLADAQRTLMDQDQQKRNAEAAAKHLLIFNHQLTRSLNIERIINEPLRHTNHTSTTLSHIMRSFTAPMVADRSHLSASPPLPPPLSTPLYPHASPASPTTTPTAAYPPNPTPQTIAPRPSPSTPVQPPAVSPTPDPHRSPHGTSPPSPSQAPADAVVQPAQQLSTTPISPSLTPQYYSTIQGAHENIRSAGRSTLTRLGRAWATTTETAGLPHPVFLDNPARFRPLYNTAQDRKPSRPRSAGPATRPRPQALYQPVSPVSLETLLLFSPPDSSTFTNPNNTVTGAAGRAGVATPRAAVPLESYQRAGRAGVATPRAAVPLESYQRPSTTMLRTYHDSRAGTPRTPTNTTAATLSPTRKQPPAHRSSQKQAVSASPQPKRVSDVVKGPSRRSPGHAVVTTRPYADAKHHPFGRVSSSSATSSSICAGGEDIAVRSPSSSSVGTVEY